MKKLKSENGITLVSLIMTIIILSILSTITINTINYSRNIAPYNKMIADINLLEDKALVYYNKYGEIPVIENTEETIDGVNYSKINVNKFDNITLNYGTNSEDGDYYLINNGLEVYYKKGTQKLDKTYHTK